MPLVKNVFVRIKTDGAAQAKADMADLAERARAIGRMDPTIKLTVTDESALARLRALRIELTAMRLAGDKIGLARVANDLQRLGENANAPRLKLMALAAEMAAVRAATDRASAGVDGGGGRGGLVGALAKLGGIIPGVTGTGPGAALVGGGILAVISSGLLGIITDLTAAALGMAAFGGLAFPTFSGVAGAIGDTQKQLAKLPPGMRDVVKGIQNLQPVFHSLVVAIRPLAVAIMGDFLKIANELLPAILPLATAAGNALVGLFGHLADSLKLTETHTRVFVDSFGHVHELVTTTTTPFGEFIKQMTALAGPTITTVGEGLGKIVVALGKLLLALANPNSLRAAKILLNGIAGAITLLAWFIAQNTKTITIAMHDVAVDFDRARHFIAHSLDDIRAVWDRFFPWLKAAVLGMGILWKFAWGDMERVARYVWARIGGIVQAGGRLIYDIMRTVMDLVHGRWGAAWSSISSATGTWIREIIHIILSLTSGFGHLLWDAGVALLNGLIGGIKSMLGPLGGILSTVGHWIKSFFPFSPAKQGPLSGSGSMETAGRHISEDLARGIINGGPMIRIAAYQLAKAVWGLKGGPWQIPGSGATLGAPPPGWNAQPGAFNPGGPMVQFSVAAGAENALLQALWPFLRAKVRSVGGGGPQSVQRALGVVYR